MTKAKKATHLKVTIVNDEAGDKGSVVVTTRTAHGEESRVDLPEGSEDEFRFEAIGGSITISAP